MENEKNCQASTDPDSYLLAGYPQNGPTAFVFRDDAGLLRQAFEGAFDHFADNAVSGNRNSNGTVIFGRAAVRTKQGRQ